MHWNTELFVATREIIQAIVSDNDFSEISSLHRLSSALNEDLKGLLDTPPKSEANRRVLQKGMHLKAFYLAWFSNLQGKLALMGPNISLIRSL